MRRKRQILLPGVLSGTLFTGALVIGAGLLSPTVASASARMAGIGHPAVGVSPGQVAPSTTGPTRTGVRAGAYDDPGVLTFGDAPYLGAPTNGGALNAPVVAMATTTQGDGYWLTAADGGVFAYGSAGFFGSAGSLPINAPVVGMEATPDAQGYWQVAIDGGIFAYGSAGFYGSTGAITLNQPVVAMASTPDGKGYWLVASDGGIFAYGDATFYGSTGAMVLNSPIVGMASTRDGKGYYLVAADGGIFNFGDAAFYGSLGGDPLPASIAGMALTPDGAGYWLVGTGGGVYPLGDAVSYGQSSGIQPTEPISAINATPDGKGYWLLEPDAFPTGFNHPGSGSAIVAAAASQVMGDPYTGAFCNPYGPCEAWCALFATWAWNQAGIPIPRFAFVGDVYNWAAQNSGVLSPGTTPAPGDAVLYGTGPANVYTAVHMGIVAQVWPDGAIDTVEGDSGPAPEGHFNVTINGPFLPSQSENYNGVGIFAFAQP